MTQVATSSLAVAADVLLMPLPLADRRAMLGELRPDGDASAYESVLVGVALGPDEDLAIDAVRLWMRTARKLTGAFVAAADAPHIPEARLQLILDHAHAMGGHALVARLAGAEQPETRDPVTLARLFRRALQWSCPTEPLMVAAERTLLRAVEAAMPRTPALVFAAEYVARFAPETLFHLVSSPTAAREWRDVLLGLYQLAVTREPVERALQALFAAPAADHDTFLRAFHATWPSLPARHWLSPSLVARALAAVTTDRQGEDEDFPSWRAVDWETFAGIERTTLEAALADAALADAAHDAHRTAAEKLVAPLVATTLPIKAPEAPRDAAVARRALFDVLYRGRTLAPSEGAAAAKKDAVWGPLLTAYLAPTKGAAKSLLSAARALPSVFVPAVARVVGRHAGADDLLPYLVDRLGTDAPHELAAVGEALVGLGTTQSLTHAVRLLTRPTLTLSMKLDLCQDLAEADLTQVQGELRSASDRLLDGDAAPTRRTLELRDALRSLMTVTTELPKPAVEAAGSPDRAILARIPAAARLPDEAMRALRTARLFADTLASGKDALRIDVSPAVDLQYKSIEILFRTMLQDRIVKLVQSQQATLQRKLEAIGYGASAREGVLSFETYLAGLPAISDIPQLSTYKLSRTLMGIAAYRPGRRFVLEGLKAYAIFFAAFSRTSCDHGLAGLFPTRFANDGEMLAFCRDLHIFHDVRNQAVHEGLAAQAQGNLDALWSLTGSLITRSFAALV